MWLPLHDQQRDCRILAGSDARILIWDAQEAISPDIALPQLFVGQLAHANAGTAHVDFSI